MQYKHCSAAARAFRVPDLIQRANCLWWRMADTHALWDDELMAGASSVEEARLFQNILRGIGPLPSGVRRVQFRFDDDSMGDPAVWIELVADEDLNPSNEKLDALRRVIDEVKAAIRRSDTARWPYSKILTEPVNDAAARSA